MAHSIVWDYLLIQRQNKNSKNLTEENVSESGFRSYTKFSLAYLNDEEEISFFDLSFYMGFLDLICLT